jgi:hypothetical protein
MHDATWSASGFVRLSGEARASECRICVRQSARRFQNLHFAFCILNYGLAGSISTAMLRHLPCRNLTTLIVARVAWPTTIAVQMCAASSPYSAWKIVHKPSGTITCETIEM